jgi:drug/metabolite transporter (DMT)-like permease
VKVCLLCEIVFLRTFIGALVLIPLVYKQPFSNIIAKGTIKFHFARASLGVIAMVCFAYAFKHLRLADGTAIGYTNPLFLAILAFLFLKEKIPKIRWLAIALGFLGVILVAQPDSGVISFAALVLVFGCIIAAASDIFVRILTGWQSSLSIVVVFSALSSLLLLPAIPFVWKTPDPFVWMLCILIGIGGAATQLLFTRALQLIPASLVAPFSYTSLVWVVMLGYAFWGDVPTARGVLGTLFIIADGCLAIASSRKFLRKSSA